MIAGLPPLDLLGRLQNLELANMTILNLGAGKCDSPISEQVLQIPCQWLISVDVYREYLDILRTKPFRAKEHSVLQMDARLAVSTRFDTPVDVILALDFIEHLPLDEGLDLLKRARQMAKQRVLVWLPLGICPQDAYDGNPHQRHLSIWTNALLTLEGFVVERFERFHQQFNPPVDAGWAVWDNPRYHTVIAQE